MQPRCRIMEFAFWCYLCEGNINSLLLQTNPIMKNKIIAILLIAITAVSLSSCATSRSKYGCPGNPTVNSRFRG
jgi:hypothetical protein